jgi:hypothetical protein
MSSDDKQSRLAGLAERHWTMFNTLKQRWTKWWGFILSRKCPECGPRVQAQLPLGVPRRHFGPTLMPTAAIPTGRYRLSRGEAQQLLDEVWSAKISLGTLY